MISADALRKIQQEKRERARADKSELKEKLKTAFVTAADDFYKRIVEECQIALEYVASTKYYKNYIILNHAVIMKDIGSYKASTLMYGFWSKEKLDFETTVFEDYRIEMPFKRAVEECANTGYKLEDVSDHKRSNRIMLKLSWRGEERRERRRSPSPDKYRRRRSVTPEARRRSITPEARRRRSPSPQQQQQQQSMDE
jgi:hypothetical protein